MTSVAGGQPLRVLMLTKGLGPGGAEKLISSVLQGGRDRGIDYDVAYVLPWKNHLVGEIEAAGARTVCLSRIGMRDPGWIVRLNRLIRSGRYHVVHVHAPLVASVARPLVRALGSRRPALVGTEHNGWATFARPTRLVNSLTSPLQDGTFAVSEQVRQSMRPSLRRQVEVLVHGVPLDQARAVAQRGQVRAELGIDEEAVVIGTVGNYRAQKAYPDLLAAASIVTAAEPRTVFVAVGQGPLESEIHRIHAEHRLGERFRLLGYRADAVRVMSGCDVFTMASHHEGLPVALMEALALGLPVVATGVGGIPDAVRHGQEGLLVEPRAPEKLAAALLTVVRSSELRARLGAAAVARSGDFDIQRARQHVEDTYRRLSARRCQEVVA